tara:strand:+ start:671 stop:1849 length:1179 start_codon:yes stop_codon:yes gene_type:complete
MINFKKSKFLPYGKQKITRADIRKVVSTLKSDFLTQGPIVPEFESNLSSIVDVNYSVAVNSATSALHLACLALDLKSGDYLWTSPISFVASANCALYCGAKVDFVDINPDNGLIDENLLEIKLEKALIQKKLPKILVPVHLAGTSCNMERIFELSKKYNFRIIEDASHALGGRYKDKPIGNCKYSDITVFSFHPVKIITTGEGGMATTNSKLLAKKMEKLRSHGINKNQSEFCSKDEGLWHYEQTNLGFNYRLSDIHAALGISQLKRLSKIIDERNRILNIYKSMAKSLKISFLDIPKDCLSAVHLGIIKLNTDDPEEHKNIFKKMRMNNIGVQLHYIPIHTHPFYQKLGFKFGDFPHSENYAKKAMSLPLFIGLNRKKQRKIISILTELIK